MLVSALAEIQRGRLPRFHFLQWQIILSRYIHNYITVISPFKPDQYYWRQPLTGFEYKVSQNAVTLFIPLEPLARRGLTARGIVEFTRIVR